MKKQAQISSEQLEDLVFMSDDFYLPYKRIPVEQPFYSGNGNHSVTQLEQICNQYKEYCHEQTIIKQNCKKTIKNLRLGLSNQQLNEIESQNDNSCVETTCVGEHKPYIEPTFKDETIREMYKFLNLLSNNIGEILNEYHWREIVALMKDIEIKYSNSTENHYNYNRGARIIVGDLVEVTNEYNGWEIDERFVIQRIVEGYGGECRLYDSSFDNHILATHVDLIKRKKDK